MRAFTAYAVYVLIDPFTDEVVYVGMSNRFRKRLHEHVNGAHTFDCLEASVWRNRIRDHGSCKWNILEDGLSRGDAKLREKYWISRLWNEGHPLFNLNHNPGNEKILERIRSSKWLKEHETRLTHPQ